MQSRVKRFGKGPIFFQNLLKDYFLLMKLNLWAETKDQSETAFAQVSKNTDLAFEDMGV